MTLARRDVISASWPARDDRGLADLGGDDIGCIECSIARHGKALKKTPGSSATEETLEALIAAMAANAA